MFVISDGKNYIILPEAKDYKRIGENDTGLNTGGMGAVSPVNFATKQFLQLVEESIIKPTVDGLNNENIDSHLMIQNLFKTDTVLISSGSSISFPKDHYNLALTASNLYAKNLLNFVTNLYDKEKKEIKIDLNDEITNKTLIKKDL